MSTEDLKKEAAKKAITLINDNTIARLGAALRKNGRDIIGSVRHRLPTQQKSLTKPLIKSNF